MGRSNALHIQINSDLVYDPPRCAGSEITWNKSPLWCRHWILWLSQIYATLMESFNIENYGYSSLESRPRRPENESTRKLSSMPIKMEVFSSCHILHWWSQWPLPNLILNRCKCKIKLYIWLPYFQNLIKYIILKSRDCQTVVYMEMDHWNWVMFPYSKGWTGGTVAPVFTLYSKYIKFPLSVSLIA